MQRIMEPIFEIAYLVVVLVLGVRILKASAGRRQFRLMGTAALVLGAGDGFHLLPRIYATWTDGVANHPASLGFGTAVTSVTMTVFYVLLYRLWRVRYGKGAQRGLTAAVYALGAVRVALCLFPQNRWLSPDAPLSWGIYRNIPFVLLGLLVLFLYQREAALQKDRGFRWMWLAIALSFAFYLPVVLFTDTAPALGMLMIPKTCAYVWMVWMGWRAAKRDPGGDGPHREKTP